MTRFQTCLSFALLIVCASSACMAATIGPYEDFRATITPSPMARMGMTGGSKDGWNLKDSNMVYLAPGSPDVNLRGAAYATSTTPDFSGSVILTTIYGIDVDPVAPDLRIRGFDPHDPEIDSIFDETYIGISGTPYPATVAMTPTLPELATLLPGFDLSPFSGAPDSFFYVFRGAVPGSDFQLIPEPASLTLAAVAGLLCAAAAGYKRYRCGKAGPGR